MDQDGDHSGDECAAGEEGGRDGIMCDKGFRDLLFIRNQARPHIFDLKVRRPGMIYERVVEVEERVVLAQDDAEPGGGPCPFFPLPSQWTWGGGGVGGDQEKEEGKRGWCWAQQ